MAQYVIHKKGFFYTDEYFSEFDDLKGKVVGIFNDLESAKAAKIDADLASLKQLQGYYIDEFIFRHSNKKMIIATLASRFPEHFNEDSHVWNWTFPSYLEKSEAAELLHILEISFHDIVEYEENETPKSEIKSVMRSEIQEF